MHGILASGSTLQINMLLFSTFEQCKAKGGDAMTDTMKGAWKLLVWSFEVLFSGYHPKTDHNGNPWPRHSAEHQLAKANTPLADDRFGVIWMLKGDLDHFATNLHVASYRTNMPCAYCPADRGEGPGTQFTNFNKNADWKNKIVRRSGVEGFIECRSPPVRAHALPELPQHRTWGTTRRSFSFI